MADTRTGRGVTFAIDAVVNPIIKLTTETTLALKKAISDIVSDGMVSEETMNKAQQQISHIKDIMKRTTSAVDENGNPIYSDTEKGAIGAMNAISSGESKIATEGLKIMKKSVGFLEDIHQRLVQSSPLLKTIESLFNLAVQLFFMPLGNKLAEVMIPAVVELVDQVTDLWAKFEGKTLGQILETMLEEGVKIFGGYFLNLAKQLEGEGSILGSISSLLTAIGNFLTADIEGVLKMGLNILTFLVSHFKELIATVVAFKVASLANQVATMYVIGVSGSIAGKGGAGIGAALAASTLGAGASVAVGAGAGMMAYNVMNGENLGDAALHTAGTALMGERNYTIAKGIRDKITSSAASSSANKQTTINNTYNFNGLTDQQLVRKIKDVNNEQASNSVLYRTR